jgi:hypothetical protein
MMPPSMLAVDAGRGRQAMPAALLVAGDCLQLKPIAN